MNKSHLGLFWKELGNNNFRGTDKNAWLDILEATNKVRYFTSSEPFE